jgi:glutathione-regulated potassium-efflux system protein KefB
LLPIVTLLGAAVVAVPLFRRLGLGSVLGYLVAGLAIGPFGLGWFSQPEAVLHVAELGVVMFLFLVGLEMRPSHLWSLRKQIFGLGALQVAACTLLLTLVGRALGYSPAVAFIGAAGFVLTSTAIVMPLLGERGDIALPRGQRIVSIQSAASFGFKIYGDGTTCCTPPVRTRRAPSRFASINER